MLIFPICIARYKSISHYICINTVFKCYLNLGKYFQMFESEIQGIVLTCGPSFKEFKLRDKDKHIGPLGTLRFTNLFKFYHPFLLNFIIFF